MRLSHRCVSALAAAALLGSLLPAGWGTAGQPRASGLILGTAAAGQPCTGLGQYWTVPSPRRPAGGVKGAGVLESRNEAGKVTCRLSSAMLGVPAQPHGWFGADWTYSWIRRPDGSSEDFVAVGMPGATYGRGAVAVIPVSAGVPSLRAAVWLPVRSLGLRRGDRLGAQVITAFGVDTSSLVVIAGAPGRDVGRAVDAGALVTWVIRWNARAKGHLAVSRPKLLRQGAGGIGEVAERGDHFGSVLEGDWGGSGPRSAKIIVGVPDEDIGGRTDAGMLATMTLNAKGSVTRSRMQWQGHGLPGRPFTGDRLGAALGLSGFRLEVIGIPGKDVHGDRDAGAVLMGAYNNRDRWREVTQDSAKVPGRSESGDRFGAAVAVGGNLIETEGSRAIVGAPGEDVGRRGDVGSVVYLALSGDRRRAPAGVAQRTSGLATGDRFGSSFELDNPLEEDEPTRWNRVLIGAPGRDIPGARNVGRLYWANVRWARPKALATPFANGDSRNQRLGEPSGLPSS